MARYLYTIDALLSVHTHVPAAGLGSGLHHAQHPAGCAVHAPACTSFSMVGSKGCNTITSLDHCSILTTTACCLMEHRWQRMPWIFVIIALSGAACLLALAWVFVFKVRGIHIPCIHALLPSHSCCLCSHLCVLQRSTRPRLLQDVIDLRKRLRGAPTGGTVSIVVTDIQGKGKGEEAE